jgi:hypothetical protein
MDAKRFVIGTLVGGVAVLATGYLIAEGNGLRHHSIGQSNVKRLLDPQQQLHTFEAADPQIAFERVFEAWGGRGAAKFPHEPGRDREELAFDVSLSLHHTPAGRSP